MPIPKLVVTLALMAAQTAMAMTRKTEGPRLDELDVTTADYGTPLPRFWGIRRFECPIIWAEKLKEKKKKSKGKAGKNTEYKYSGTWDVAIADHEIDVVSRIWMDRRLCYDATRGGPISIASLFHDHLTGGSSPVKLQLGKNMRVYLGTETQGVDPRYEQWCEDRYGGTGFATAYRGVAHIVFQDIPLEKFGNRIPQISVEAVSVKDDAFPYEIKDGAGSGIDGVFSSDGLLMYQEDSVNLFVWDVPSRTLINERTGIVASSVTAGSGVIYTTSGATLPVDGQLWVFNADGSGGANLTPSGFDCSTGGCRYVAGNILFYPFSTFAYYGVYGDATVTAIFTSYCPTFFFEGPDGSAWACGSDESTLDNLWVGRLLPDQSVEAQHITSGSGAYGMWNGEGGILVWQSNELYLLDETDPSIILVGPVSLPVSSSFAEKSFKAVLPGAARIWIGVNEVNTLTLEIIRSIELNDWILQSSLTSGVYDVVNHAFVTHETATDELTWRYIDRVTSNGVELRDVIDDVAGWVGLSGLDTSAQTQTVQGYSVTQGSGKDMLAPLLDIHDVDPRPHDFNIQFVNRGSSPSLTIATTELVREGEENRYVASITQDTDLPRKVTLTFADLNHDQQPNTVIAQRPLDSVDAVREANIDLTTYVETPANAQKFADRYHRRQWIGREKFTLALTAQRLSLEPADVLNLELDGITTSARLTKLTLANGRLNTEWERDAAIVHTLASGSGSAMDGRDDEIIYVPGPTKGFVKDIPLLSDNDNDANPLLYYGAGPYSAAQNWPGATVYKGDASGVDYDTDWNAVDSADASMWGYATDVLPDALSTVWDRGSSVNVKGYLTLSSVTEADIDEDPTLNLALLGDELLNFTTATLETDGSYTLSGFKRGRRGTEWATSIHEEGEDFVLASELANEGIGLSDVGVDLHFKAQTFGRPVDSATAIDVEFAGRSLMPYAPARLATYYDGTDLQCTITRRTRVGGAFTPTTWSVPLSENSEEYEVEVYNGVTLKRTITVSGTNVFTYTAAMASADSITLPTPPSFIVYQMSDAVGRGFALAA